MVISSLFPKITNKYVMVRSSYHFQNMLEILTENSTDDLFKKMILSLNLFQAKIIIETINLLYDPHYVISLDLTATELIDLHHLIGYLQLTCSPEDLADIHKALIRTFYRKINKDN